ncbi:hypothetical protein DIU31_005865 [Mucilaginibacter rubeus]|uniref:DNA-binding protein n=1 Tax=Mucilaginibacter rubeus TaxID=2027860 RepID=A0AAE6JCB2_9SPHI|nr:hypothetical protein [Mucilaginibacter rubeus]QEM03069.1 hypothetical protein DIU31_005865 [Mucilaginibacter rubeus]QTE41576.1 hypothetical protein J3L19_21855 [Mucilaginibacter rubeus]QTE48182.1 hypothetical protein J3L21_21855 [Mucilaginibacter rubeus]QTE59572.1 hypothetical protein J3L23_13495 [Mucilaginibacter rubeus]QTE60967.1 hypothetical protein J3L22_20350 [Mucilaginibacter rubeus]
MKLDIYIDRINKLDKLLEQKTTGTPAELAKKLKISKSRLFCVIDDLKYMDVPIKYSRKLQTYYYQRPYKIEIILNFTDLSIKQGPVNLF